MFFFKGVVGEFLRDKRGAKEKSLAGVELAKEKDARRSPLTAHVVAAVRCFLWRSVAGVTFLAVIIVILSYVGPCAHCEERRFWHICTVCTGCNVLLAQPREAFMCGVCFM